MALWDTWHQGGRKPAAMEPLLRAFDGAVNREANQYIRSPKFPLHPDVIRNQFRIQAVRGFETFNPKMGVQLNTHVTNMMRKATRYLIRHQNIGVIPEVRALRVRDFYEAKNLLVEKLRREPTQFEMSRKLRWSPMEIKRMESELSRQPRPTGEREDDPLGMRSSQEAEVLHMIRYELGPEEQVVYEHLFGMGGKKRINPGQIAKKLRWTPSKVTRVKNKIVDKINHYL